MYLEKDVNKLFNNIRRRTKFSRVFVFGNELKWQQKKKMYMFWFWAVFSMVIYLVVLFAALQWLSIETLAKLIKAQHSAPTKISYLLLIGFVILVPLIVIMLITFNKISSVYKLPTKGIKGMHDYFFYDEFQKWLEEHYISDDVVWHYVLPYVIKQKERKDKYTLVSFFRVFLPGISASVPMATMSIMAAIWIADPNVKESVEEALNIIIYVAFMLTSVTLICSILIYISLPSVPKLSDSKLYQKLELTIYAYFFDKGRRERWE